MKKVKDKTLKQITAVAAAALIVFSVAAVAVIDELRFKNEK